MGRIMIPQRQNRFAGVSLAPPETIQANFGAPAPMQVPQMEDMGDPYAGLQSLGHQFAQGRMQKHVGQLTDKFVGRDQPLETPQGVSGIELSPPPKQRFAGSQNALMAALKGAF